MCAVFKRNYGAYGTRRLQKSLRKEGIIVSRRKLGQIMKANQLVSKYTHKKYRSKASDCNHSPIKNELNREFKAGQNKTVLVTDLTYVKVKQRWHYLCVIVDIKNREIVGRSVGAHKTADLVLKAMSQIKLNLNSVDLFHSDRGKEFDNHLIEDCLNTFGIIRSLSHKGCPYDNAIAEATFKAIKTEFIGHVNFDSLEQLEVQFNHYVDWFNYIRLHSVLNYQSPIEYKNRIME